MTVEENGHAGDFGKIVLQNVKDEVHNPWMTYESYMISHANCREQGWFRKIAEMDVITQIKSAIDGGVVKAVSSLFDFGNGNSHSTFTILYHLMMMLLSLDNDKSFPKTKSTFDNTYDYIIVGGGTAGCVMANRLSQKPCVSVLLLEAGGYAPPITNIPSYASFFYNSEIDWHYKTTPQKYGAYAQINNRVLWNSGKCLGGGSALNSMIYVRGNRKDYDAWAADGCDCWSYDKVLPFFIKLENTSALSPSDIDPSYHGTCGPMSIEKPINNDCEIKAPVLEALTNMGMELRDPNSKRQTGIYEAQGTLRNGQRCSTAKAYLVPVEDRPNLTILKQAFVKKIILKYKRAIGVEFDFEGRGNTKNVYAKKEVIISAGSVRTPQLLMLSGIGPKKELEKHNITCVVNRPAVGKNLQDHCTYYVPYLMDPSIKQIVAKNVDPVNIFKYLKRREGCLSSPNGITCMAFINGQNTSSTSPDCPRQQLYFAEYTTIFSEKNYNLKPEVFSQYYKKYELNPMYTCMVCLLQPESRGEILLNSTDPYEQPLINPNYYKEERDVKDMVEGIKVCEAVSKSPGMKKLGVKSFDTPYPGCEKYFADKDKYYECCVRSEIVTIWHPVGTARMGLPDDPRSVVDCQLKVIGVKNLRVVNAAVMPKIPSGNTNVPTIMIAERVYDMMKDDISCS